MKNLINEYKMTCEVLEKRLNELKEKLLTVRGDEAVSIKKRIEVIREEICDIRHILDYLITNYSS